MIADLILLIAFLVLVLCSYYVVDRCILAPAVIANGVFFVSVLILSLNFNSWRYDVSMKTALVLVFGMSVFTLGCYIGKRSVLAIFPIDREKTNNYRLNENCCPKRAYLFFELVSVVISSSYAFFQLKLSTLLGNINGVAGMFDSIRHNTSGIESQISRILQLGICFSKAFGIVAIYWFVNSLTNKQEVRKCKKYLIPIFCYVSNCVFSTSRVGFIEIVVIFAVDYYLSLSQFDYKNANKQTIKILVFLISLFSVAFLFLGRLRDFEYTVSPFTKLSVYSSSSIIGIDNYLNGNIFSTTNYLWGQNCFAGIYSFLRIIGFDIPEYSTTDPIFSWSDLYSNIYTTFYWYIKDFGIISCFFILFFLGVLSTRKWRQCVECRASTFLNAVYGSVFSYPLALISISELFLGRIALNYIATLFFVFFILKISKNVDIVST